MTFEEERRSGLGSTDSPAILGLSPWKSAHDVWLSKMGKSPEREPSLQMFLGSKLETAIGELYTANTGTELVRDESHYSGPGFMRSHIDFRPTDALNLIVEAKTSRSKRGWGEALFSDDVPRHYWTQVQHQMACLPIVECVDIAVLFGHDEFRIYRIQRNQAFIDSLVEDMNAWWEQYVIPGVPPPVDGSEAAGRWLRESYPRESTPELVPATPEVMRIVQDLQVVRATAAALSRSDELMVQQLKDIIKDRPGMYGTNFTIRWKQNRSRKIIDWEAIARLNPEVETLLPQFTTIKEGARPFILEEVND